jgi:hypothetical protein
MTSPITLNSPKYRVVLGDPADPATWSEHEVQAITRDIQNAEALFVRHKWGNPANQPIKITAVAAFYALVRSGQIDAGTSWPQFEANYLEVSEAGSEQVGPTDPDLDPDY